ncbi:parvulin peptidyl-prolyl isomerase [Amycolatopsis sp. K13G38]|uniref:Parvulin peptidyl-prolyl isomerase n=1 Tax=Amycolatopsis acididurans TaxID=2724524 RepID=A0ABX1JD64_9PSEU|nr:peptidyl-prolyl cis-trans isomerase [Amycolatopsis acididurans]NKQ57732.1 parvulin peptidyl-prolyl isomerase [Amycolatopsis acididurans]
MTIDAHEEVADEVASESDVDERRSGRPRWRPRLPRTRRGRWIALAVVALLAAAGGGGYYWYQSTQLPAGAAFEVGGRVVSIDELNQEVQTLRALYGVQPPTDEAKLDGFRRDAAKSYAVSLLLDQAARDANVTVADKTARDTLTKFVSRQLGDGPDAQHQFVQALGDAGTSEQAVLDEIRRQMTVSQLFNQITAGTTVSDDEVRSAFTTRGAQLATPEKRQLSNIVVSTKEQADQVVADLRGGTPFSAETQRYSVDGSTRDKGGDLGEVAANQLDKTYADAAFAAQPGQIFGPVQTQYGWNVGQVVHVVPATPAVFDQVKDQLKQDLVLEKALGTWRNWLAQRISDGHVRYADAYQPADADSPPPLQQSPAAQPK